MFTLKKYGSAKPDPKFLEPEGGMGSEEKDPKKKREKKRQLLKSVPLIWRLEGGAPESSRMAEPTQDFMCLTFVDDTAPFRVFNKEGKLVTPDGREGNPDQLWGGMRGRVVVGTQGGDLYVYWQPRMIPSEYDGLTKDEYDENELLRQSIRKPWWEQPEGTPIDDCAEFRWESSARLVHVVPRDNEYGNSHIISKRNWEKLQGLRKQLKVKPNDNKLKQMADEISYQGNTGHRGGVSQVAWQGDGMSSRLMSCGKDQFVRVWNMVLNKAPSTYGVLGEIKTNNGSHNLEPFKAVNLSEKRPLVNVSQPDQGDVDPLGKTIITSIDWDDARVILGAASNTLIDFFSATMEFEVLARSHTDAINGMSVHRTLPIYATVSVDKTVRVWRGHPDSAVEDILPKGEGKKLNCFRRCVATGDLPAEGFCVAWHPTKPELACGLADGSFVICRLNLGGPNESGELATDVSGAISKSMKDYLQYGVPNVRKMDLVFQQDYMYILGM